MMEEEKKDDSTYYTVKRGSDDYDDDEHDDHNDGDNHDYDQEHEHNANYDYYSNYDYYDTTNDHRNDGGVVVVGGGTMMRTTRRRRGVNNHQHAQQQRRPQKNNEDGNDDDHSREDGQRTVKTAKTKNHHHRQRRQKRRRRKHKDHGYQSSWSFLLLVIQVGTTLLALCLVLYHTYRWVYPSLDNNNGYQMEVSTYNDDDDDNGNNNAEQLQRQHQQQLPLQPPVKPTPPPLPTYTLSDASQFDVYGIMSLLTSTSSSDLKQQELPQPHKSFWLAANGLRQRFMENYGGENPARMLLDQGTTTYHSSSSSQYDTNIADVPMDIITTACRLYDARTSQRPFRMSFGGYSVTTGRGNKHEDSYPLQLQSILETVVKMAGIPDLIVHNAAIGGCPSFPYGWCMSNFWGGGSGDGSGSDSDGDDVGDIVPDVVNWDYSMNESNGSPEGLEAYVRHLLSTYGRRSKSKHQQQQQRSSSSSSPSINIPKLIIKDHSTAKYRRALIQEYNSWLQHDAVTIHTDRIVQPFLAREEEYRPLGFQNWREWGAPKGAPGQALHHPAKQEHALNAWILAMHFLTSLEYMMGHLVDQMEKKDNTDGTKEEGICDALYRKDHDNPLLSDNPTNRRPPNTNTLLSSSSSSSASSILLLPPPVSGTILNKTDIHYDPILFGRPIINNDNGDGDDDDDNNNSTMWTINPIQCRTTFQPIRHGDLSDIVVSGTIGEDVDSSLPKSQMYYNSGWTLDFSEAERIAKRRLQTYPNGLGFVDSKEAYYGIYESPHMKLLLPLDSTSTKTTESSTSTSTTSSSPQIGDTATDWIESIVLCEVNEKVVEPNKCNLNTDIGLLIGGVNVTLVGSSTAASKTTTTDDHGNGNSTTSTTAVSSKMINSVGSVYLGRPICKHVSIPSDAKLTSHNHLLIGSGHSKYVHEDDRYLPEDQVGLLVEVYVSNPHIVHVNQACSISHVIWSTTTV